MLKRFLTLGSGEAIGRVLYVLAFVVLARALGKTALGQFGLALTITSYLLLAVQQGIDQIAAREVSRDLAQLDMYVRGLFGLRLTIAAAVFLLLFAYTKAAQLAGTEATLLLIFGMTCFSTALAPRWAFPFLAPRQLAISGVLSQTIFFCGAMLVTGPGDLFIGALAYVAGEVAAMAYLLLALIPFGVNLVPAIAPRFWLRILKESWPVSVSSLLGIVVYNFDVLALGWLATPAEVGLYIACYRCATVFSPFLSMLQLSILPAFANTFPDAVRLRRVILGVIAPAVAIAVIVAVIFSIIPAMILRAVYGAGYLEGASLLRVLAWSLPFQAARSVLRQALLAASLQRLDTINMACAALTCVGVDLLLIPRIGPMACAISTGLGELVLVIMSSAALRRRFAYHLRIIGDSD